MKKLSRLTALLLALLMLLAAPVSALATTITIDDYNQAKENAEQANSQGGVPTEEETQSTVTVTSEGEAIQRETVEGAISDGADNSFTLPIAGKLVLSAGASADAYQWQILAQGVWANIVGENGASVTLTYAMLENALTGNTAVVRCCLGEGESARYTAEATVAVDETVVTTPVVEENEVAVTSYYGEAPVNTYRLRLAELADEGAVTYDDTPTTYNIVINYTFGDGTVAANQWTATVSAGSSFYQVVTSPVVQGYTPQISEKGTWVSAETVTVNYTDISADQTINVQYNPINVNYTVIHYQQNQNDDNYTEVARETKQGLTNDTVPEAAEEYEGFYALLYERPAIAADGSTVVEIYYDRYYYLMNFDLDGGYGVEPIYARYGATIGDVGTPTKAGYAFQGWSLDGTTTVDLPKTMPAENRTYKAVWQANDTAKVTVVFWGENADDEGYSYIRSMKVDATPEEKYTFDGSTLTCPLVEHNHTTENCTLECVHKSHTLDCYSTDNDNGFTKIEEPTYALTDLGNGIHYRSSKRTDYYYLQIGDLWYCGTNWWGNADATQRITFTCSHTHTDACYSCGLTEHTHGSDCSGLWTFEKSDTVTVAADGSSVVNVYYDRTEKTLTFKYNYSYLNYQSTETITAKWGSNISKQYKEIAVNAGSTFWSAETSGKGPYTNYFGVMPQTSATYYNRGASGNEGTMTYWGQDQNGNYTVKLFEVTGVGGYYVTDEDRYEFQGFTYHHGTSNKSDCDGATFYYTRNSYTLTFNDGYNVVNTETVKYEAPLSTYSSYVPEVPSAYEPDSVTFGGWYLNPECTGVEYKLDEHTMPADNVLLYAKWVPVTHKVEFYLDKAALDAGTKLSTHPDITVPHGSKADPTPEDPTNGSYTFVGWFYKEGGVEKAFDFANMPVNKDMEVYAKWSTNSLMPYTIYYKYKDTNGSEVEIAAPTTGEGLAGLTKTFDAKGGTQLYSGYQEGYFPITKSHSLTLDINATPENDTNVFTFWYVQKDAVPYIVRYVDEAGNEVVHQKVVADNRKAVVTETFVPVSGKMPDAYQKRLVVTGSDELEDGQSWIKVEVDGVPVMVHPDNVITFVYKEDDQHAYYKITHYTENLEKDAEGNTTWTEYASSQAVGDIDKTYSADPMTIPGFKYDSTVEGTVASGKLTADGLELKLYYTRNSYPYKVRYLEVGTETEKVLASDKSVENNRFGTTVSENALPIPGYECVSQTTQTLTIGVDGETVDGVQVISKNVITFYYQEQDVTINYKVVGPDGCGTVDLNDTDASTVPGTSVTETLKAVSGTAVGATATAVTPTYKFVGWYKDEDCTTPVVTDGTGNVPVDGVLSDDGLTFTPEKKPATEAVYDDKNNLVTPAVPAHYESATYYAKFEYDVGSLKITKNGLQNGEKAIFTVTVTKGDVISTYKIAMGNGEKIIANLPNGADYRVTEESWSWSYTSTATNATGTIVGGETSTATFSNTKTDKWLYDEDSRVNTFSGSADTNQ